MTSGVIFYTANGALASAMRSLNVSAYLSELGPFRLALRTRPGVLLVTAPRGGMRNVGAQLTTRIVVSHARIWCARRCLSVHTEPAHSVSYLTWCGRRGPRTRSRPRSRGCRYRRAEVDPDPVVHGAAAAGSMTLVIGRPAQVVNKRYADSASATPGKALEVLECVQRDTRSLFSLSLSHFPPPLSSRFLFS